MTFQNNNGRKYLPHSTGCFVCGESNPKGLKHRFYVEGENVCSDVFLPKEYCGFMDVVHGGISTALLDETMGWSAFIFGETDNLCFTRNLEIKYKRNVPANTKIKVVTSLINVKRGMYETVGELVGVDGKPLVTAKGLFVTIPDDKMLQTMGFLKMNENLEYHDKILRLYDEYNRKTDK